MRLFYPSNVLTPSEEIKILQKDFKNKSFLQRMIIKALWGKKVNKQFKRLHFKRIGL